MMIGYVVRRTGLLGIGLILVLSSTIFASPTHPPHAQAEELQQTRWQIGNVATGLCLDTGNQNRGNPYQSGCDRGNPAQQWVIEDNSVRGGTIRNIGGGACLDHGNSTTLGFRVYLFDCYYGSGQAFNFKGVNVGGLLYVELEAGNSGLALDGFLNNPYLFTSQSGNDHQGWVFIPL